MKMVSENNFLSSFKNTDLKKCWTLINFTKSSSHKPKKVNNFFKVKQVDFYLYPFWCALSSLQGNVAITDRSKRFCQPPLVFLQHFLYYGSAGNKFPHISFWMCLSFTFILDEYDYWAQDSAGSFYCLYNPFKAVISLLSVFLILMENHL